MNPTTWGKKSYIYEGRRLKSFRIVKTVRRQTRTFIYDYEYDEQCHRIKKTCGSNITNYTYSGDNLVIEDGPNGKLLFLYDEKGQLYGFVKDEKKYFYIKDVTGTILGIVDESGTLVGKYSYTAFGKCTILVDSDSIATINPFRFKSYYYDTESEMYYCQTRYYVPEWGRWLNADNPGFLQFDSINGMNLFAYCSNSPIMYSDSSGNFLISFLIGLAIVGTSVVLSAIDGGVSAVINGQDFWKGAAAGAIGGAVGGLISLIPGLGICGSIIGRLVNSATYDILNEIFQTGSLQNMRWDLFAADLLMDGAFSLLYVGGANNIGNKFGRNLCGLASTIISSLVDSFIDIFQTKVYFSSSAQNTIRGY